MRESKERVRSALITSGFQFPGRAHHRQSISGRSAQGRRPFRSADCRRRPGRERPAVVAKARNLRILRRARAERRAARDAQALAGADGGSARRLRGDPARRECIGGGLGGRPPRAARRASARGMRGAVRYEDPAGRAGLRRRARAAGARSGRPAWPVRRQARARSGRGRRTWTSHIIDDRTHIQESSQIAIGRCRRAKADWYKLPTRHNPRGIRQLPHHSDPSGFDPTFAKGSFAALEMERCASKDANWPPGNTDG